MKIFRGIIVRQHHTDQNRMGLLREQCVEFRKGHLRYCCNPAWMKNGGRTPWNVSVIFEIFKISCLMGGHHMKGGSEYHLKVWFFRLEQWSNITLSLRRTYRDYINSFGPKVLPGTFLGYALHAVSGRETYWSQTLRNWKRWTHLKSTQRDSMQRKC